MKKRTGVNLVLLLYKKLVREKIRGNSPFLTK